MKIISRWIQNNTALSLLIILISVHLLIINDYGFTWDFHFHFFGGGKLLGLSWQELEPRILPYVEPDPRNAWSLPYGPLMSIPPVASYLLLYKYWQFLPQDSAYHLPIILWGIGGILALYGFLKEAINKRVALFAAFFLAIMPRFFADMHNNMKDIPSAAIFAVNMWLLWRLVKHKRLSDLLLAVVGFAAAFNVKINSIFIPVIFAVWLILIAKSAERRKFFAARFSSLIKGLLKQKDLRAAEQKKFAPISARKHIFVFAYFLLAPIAAFLLWWFFWPNPIAQLDHAYRTFAIGTNNIEVLLNGNWYCSGGNVPWYYPFWYLTITTPLPLLLFFLIGLISLIRHRRPIGILLLLWFFLPLSRYLLPNIGVIDGIRHFEEVLFPLAALAAIGLDFMIRQISLIRLIRPMSLILILFTVFSLLFTLYSYHPFQITYFNELVGGIKGAFGKYDLDYWGGSQKQAVIWVNENAPQNSKVHIVMSADVAGRYLRPDLLINLNKYNYDESDFVIFLNRQSFFYRFYYAYEYLLHHSPSFTVSVKNTPLVWVFDNRTDNKTSRQTPWWKGEDPCIINYWKATK